MTTLKDEIKAIFKGKTAKVEFCENTRELVARTSSGTYRILVPECNQYNEPFQNLNDAIDYALNNLNYRTKHDKVSSTEAKRLKAQCDAYAWLVEKYKQGELELILMERKYVREKNPAPNFRNNILRKYCEFHAMYTKCKSDGYLEHYDGMNAALGLIGQSRIKLRLPATLNVVHGNAIAELSDGTIVSERPITQTVQLSGGIYYYFNFDNQKIA